MIWPERTRYKCGESRISAVTYDARQCDELRPLSGQSTCPAKFSNFPGGPAKTENRPWLFPSCRTARTFPGCDPSTLSRRSDLRSDILLSFFLISPPSRDRCRGVPSISFSTDKPGASQVIARHRGFRRHAASFQGGAVHALPYGSSPCIPAASICRR